MRRKTNASGNLVTLGLVVLWILVLCPAVEAKSTKTVEGSESSEPTEVSSSKLVEEASKWNGRQIIFTGEAIGEHMVRGLKCWIHLNDDAYMWRNIEEGAKLGGYNSGQAIWVDATLANKIAYYGDYMHEGDIVKVVGKFNSVCRDHGGDMDIHAVSLEIIRVGHPIGHLVNYHRLLLAAVLLIISIILFGVRKIAVLRRT
jgi:hypothetical protein